jgi:SagB-type dehydrogenase family enzyme
MSQELWQNILVPSGNEDHVWELYHENSKIGKYTTNPSDDDVLQRMKELHESLPFDGYPIIDLPRNLPRLGISLDQAITARVSSRNFTPIPVTLEQLGSLLYYSYGVTRENTHTGLPRPFRVVPSAGALYPLEIFFFSARLDGVPSGLYHYNPAKHYIRLISSEDHSKSISEALIQPDMALNASLIIFITAFFERSVFKYGDRGYRFIFLEAGHVAQNINLVSGALNFGSVNIGGFLDREIDTLLGLDGITQSTIYMVGIGKEK